MAAKKGLMVLGIGAGLVTGLLLLLRKGKPALAEPPPNGIVVGLWNPPKEATMWSLTLTDWNKTVAIHLVGDERLDIAEAATFEIPGGVSFPLRIVFLQITKWNEDRTALIQLYYVQSWQPYLWDWDTNDWSTTPNPDYQEAFIPDYGSYYYNVAKERFEKA